MSKRNLVRQIVPLKDGEGNIIGEKNIFHIKKFHKPQYGERRSIWKIFNEAPKTDKQKEEFYARWEVIKQQIHNDFESTRRHGMAMEQNKKLYE